MRAVDTNILVFAEVAGSKHHQTAREILGSVAEGSAPWALPWPCVYEFLRVVTHPRVYHPPVELSVALADLRVILASPSLILLTETPRHTEVMDRVIRAASATGNLMHDAHIAALCLEHGISEIITGDRDFARFPDLRIINPFAAN